MPLYEYKCDKCAKVFEKIQKFSDAPLTVHEDCGGAVVRLISTSALQFKGTGFYITDYKGGSKGGAPASSGSKSGDSAGSSSSDSASPASKGDSGGSSSPASTPAPASTGSK